MLLDPIADRTRARRASLLVVDPDSGALHIAAGIGLEVGLVGANVAPRGRSISAWVLRHRRSAVLDGVVRDPRFDGVDGRSEPAACLPLVHEDRAIGVINLARELGDAPFTEAECAAIAAALPPVAAAVHAVQRALAAERAHAAIERLAAAPLALVREAPVEVRGYEIHRERRPGLRAGGAMCERVSHGDGSTSIVVLDPVARGPDAVVAAAFAQGVFAAIAAPGRSASGIVARLAAEHHARGGDGLAMWAANVTGHGEVTCSNAGVPAPFVVPFEDAEVHRLGGAGEIAGRTRHGALDEETIHLLPGDLVVVVSAALIEPCGEATEPFGAARVAELLAERRRQGVERIAAALCDAALEHAGRAALVDDLHVVVVRYTPAR